MKPDTGKESQTFRLKLLAGEPLIGTFVKTPSMMIAEVLGQTSLDAVCVDAEHSPFDRRDIDACLLAYRSQQMPALVRVPSAAPEYILNSLDCGATGVVVPHVDSAEKAVASARAARFGDGGRGYAGSTRAAAYGSRTVGANLAANLEETTVVIQIEDLAALDVIDDIAAVEGIDCLFVGTMDLTVALGATSAEDPKVIENIERICKAAQKIGRRTGIFVPKVESIPFWRERGVSLFLLSSDHAFIKQGAAALAASAREVF